MTTIIAYKHFPIWKIFNAFTISLIVFTVVGCKKFVTVPAPTTQIVTTSVFADASAATAAQLGVYGKFYGLPIQCSRAAGLSADELFTFSTDQQSLDIYHNNINAANDGASGSFAQLWPVFYANIYYENAIIENLQLSPINNRIKQQLLGEAYFTRAWLFSQLANFFGGVPITVSTDYSVNSFLAKSSQDDVYQQSINDLTTAEGLLSSMYVNETDTVQTTARVRPNTWAASALLARLYLYKKDFFNAEKFATTVINNNQFSLPSDLNAVFKSTSTEAIWQLMPPSTQAYTNDGFYFILVTGPTTSAIQSSTISSSLLNSFETNDQRKTNWIGTYTNPTTSVSYKFPYKYKRTSTTSGTNDENTMVLRLGEQYLIRAEARAQQNKISGASGALGDLNIIRHRAGLGDYGGAVDQASVLAAIAHERQVELFAEGHRWVDLRRTGTIDAVMGAPGNACATKGGTWQSYQQLYPIPLTDLQKDYKLVQNTGY